MGGTIPQENAQAACNAVGIQAFLGKRTEFAPCQANGNFFTMALGRRPAAAGGGGQLAACLERRAETPHADLAPDLSLHLP